ncbi:translation initiation factor IF-2 [Mycoplasmopsis pulmonis]|uniref:translation initiation factor IF-2 n=1 Tax=Mycoplasmopsis pulmonis TaxID=2107 RepID=UPI001004DA20|nr:translation initiation factor IF-2 [Mycoplasmopsis pulmonis]VEU67968.1 translation initiation factor IF-2 [Mycoplasmopsis pulmonis]
MAKKRDKRLSNINEIKTQIINVKTELKNGVFIFSSPMTIGEFAQKINISGTEIVKEYFLKGKMYTLNHILSEEEIADLCFKHGYDFRVEKEINASNFLDNIEFEDKKEDLETRPPIITIMGHVDHGKTTLIDKIRKSNIVSTESSGITQHTGAYQIIYDNKKITFLDTPGHEAFSAMRARGSKVTDIVILVVAADDGVKPQTKEAIAHAQAANVPIIVFVNKMDKPSKDLNRLKNDLSVSGINLEEWGGDTPIVYGSALKGEGIEKLFENINLQAEILDLKFNPKRHPLGVVIESKMDKGVGSLTTVIVQNGTLHKGDFLVAGPRYGRVKAIYDTNKKPLKKVGAGTPVFVIGLNYAPSAGEKFVGINDEKYAKKLSQEREDSEKQEKFLQQTQTISIRRDNDKKIFNIIIKSDTQGTAEAIKDLILRIANDEIEVIVVSYGIGVINNSDLLLAQTSNSEIIGFNSKPNPNIKQQAEDLNIQVNSFDVVYKIVDYLNEKINKMVKPKFEKRTIGRAKILKVFFYSKVGNIAGCLMEEGHVKSDSFVKVYRKNKLIHDGRVETLRKGPDEVKKIEKGFEFGLRIKNFDDIKEDDQLEIIEEFRI